MKSNLLLLLTLFIFSLNPYCQQTDDFKRLQNLIESQIKKDNLRQEDIINLTLPFVIKESELMIFGKSANLQKMNEFNQSLKKSTSFCHGGGYYLRIYLVASNEFSNDAKLELIRDNSSENKPDQAIRTLTDSSLDTKVSCFDYHITNKLEAFHLTLQLENKISGRALALVTMISDKEYKLDK